MTVELEVGRHAVRTFKVGTGLRGVAVPGKTWEKGACHAVCNPPPLRLLCGVRPHNHRAPDEHCECGIYGALQVEDLFWQFPRCSAKLITVIAPEGKTIIGPKGLKTEYARIVAYWTPVRAVLKTCLSECPGADFYLNLPSMCEAYGFRKFDPTRPRYASPYIFGPNWWMEEQADG